MDASATPFRKARTSSFMSEFPPSSPVEDLPSRTMSSPFGTSLWPDSDEDEDEDFLPQGDIPLTDALHFNSELQLDDDSDEVATLDGLQDWEVSPSPISAMASDLASLVSSQPLHTVSTPPTSPGRDDRSTTPTDVSRDIKYLEHQMSLLQSPRRRKVSGTYRGNKRQLSDLSRENNLVTSSQETETETRSHSRQRRRLHSNRSDIGKVRTLFGDVSNVLEEDCSKTWAKEERLNMHVTTVINNAVDNGSDQVVLSDLGLRVLPESLADLGHIVTLSQDPSVKGGLKLFLSGNELEELDPTICSLKNLRVLSLRQNKITKLPPDVGELVHLNELSIGSNQLTYVPAELLDLEQLQLVMLTPNPLLEPPSTDNIVEGKPPSPQHQPYTLPDIEPVPSLRSLALLTVLNQPSIPSNQDVPSHILPIRLLHDPQHRKNNKCRNRHCNRVFATPGHAELCWHPFADVPSCPFLYRFCSRYCGLTMDWTNL